MTNKSECSDDGDICSPHDIIEKIGETLNVKGSSGYIIEKSKQILSCDSESCILSNPTIVDSSGESHVNKIKDFNFKPEGPRNSTELLSNYNIDDVLDQWEKQYDGFYHIYFQMIDFDYVGTELATVDVSHLIRQNYKTMGVVLNTDVSTGGGIHWFCLFCDLTARPITLEYFNSSEIFQDLKFKHS